MDYQIWGSKNTKGNLTNNIWAVCQHKVGLHEQTWGYSGDVVEQPTDVWGMWHTRL